MNSEGGGLDLNANSDEYFKGRSKWRRRRDKDDLSVSKQRKAEWYRVVMRRSRQQGADSIGV